MRILFINAWIPPSDAPTSRLLGDVGEALAAAGHEVDFLGDTGSYRARTNRNVFQRGFGEISRLWKLWREGKRRERPDLIVALSSPPLLLPIAVKIAQHHRSPLIHWAMDVYPEIAVQLGVLGERSPMTALSGRLMKFGYDRCERLVALDEAMEEFLAKKSDTQIEISQPWILPQFLEHESNPQPQKMDEDPIWLYSGNLGRAHEWKVLLKVQQLLESANAGIRLVIQGGGAGVPKAEQLAEDLGLQKVEFRPFAADDATIASLLNANVLVATQLPETLGLLWPSKLSLMRHLDRPLLWIGPENTVIDELQASGRSGVFSADQEREIADWLIQTHSLQQSVGFDRESAEALRNDSLAKWVELAETIHQK
ncbi:MAG: glycosyltransferase [Verrucomicrobiota bacterium]